MFPECDWGWEDEVEECEESQAVRPSAAVRTGGEVCTEQVKIQGMELISMTKKPFLWGRRGRDVAAVSEIGREKNRAYMSRSSVELSASPGAVFLFTVFLDEMGLDGISAVQNSSLDMWPRSGHP